MVKSFAERLSVNDLDLKYFKGRNAVDIGCGPGRFSIVLKKLGVNLL
jgi:ribosomal protein L11 methylase PrmA|tara:strand:- start:1357 stop:1497 length:141 start_codon:yes stop_codon:yes gene_type:complete